MSLLKARGLAKRYGQCWFSTASISTLGAGELVALLGESGSGKSTLLNCRRASMNSTPAPCSSTAPKSRR